MITSNTSIFSTDAQVNELKKKKNSSLSYFFESINYSLQICFQKKIYRVRVKKHLPFHGSYLLITHHKVCFPKTLQGKSKETLTSLPRFLSINYSPQVCVPKREASLFPELVQSSSIIPKHTTNHLQISFQ